MSHPDDGCPAPVAPHLCRICSQPCDIHLVTDEERVLRLTDGTTIIPGDVHGLYKCSADGYQQPVIFTGIEVCTHGTLIAGTQVCEGPAILCPTCPMCGQFPDLKVGVNALTSPHQTWCTNNNCATGCWNATQTFAWNRANLTVHDLDNPT